MTISSGTGIQLLLWHTLRSCAHDTAKESPNHDIDLIEYRWRRSTELRAGNPLDVRFRGTQRTGLAFLAVAPRSVCLPDG